MHGIWRPVPFSIDEYVGLLLSLACTKPIHCTAWRIPSAWNQQVSYLDSNSIVHNRCPPMFQNLQLPSKSYVMHLKIYQIIFLGLWETPRCHASPNILKNIPWLARKYTLIRRFFLLSTSSADLFFSRESLPNFRVNTGPLVRSMNFHALNYIDPMIFFPWVDDNWLQSLKAASAPSSSWSW